MTVDETLGQRVLRRMAAVEARPFLNMVGGGGMFIICGKDREARHNLACALLEDYMHEDMICVVDNGGLWALHGKKVDRFDPLVNYGRTDLLHQMAAEKRHSWLAVDRFVYDSDAAAFFDASRGVYGAVATMAEPTAEAAVVKLVRSLASTHPGGRFAARRILAESCPVFIEVGQLASPGQKVVAIREFLNVDHSEQVNTQLLYSRQQSVAF